MGQEMRDNISNDSLEENWNAPTYSSKFPTYSPQNVAKTLKIEYNLLPATQKIGWPIATFKLTYPNLIVLSNTPFEETKYHPNNKGGKKRKLKGKRSIS